MELNLSDDDDDAPKNDGVPCRHCIKQLVFDENSKSYPRKSAKVEASPHGSVNEGYMACVFRTSKKCSECSTGRKECFGVSWSLLALH